jgi:hypothetical protein
VNGHDWNWSNWFVMGIGTGMVIAVVFIAFLTYILPKLLRRRS